MKRNKFATLATTSMSVAIGIASLGWASMASAAPLTDVSGAWQIIGNQSAGVLQINQGTSAAACKPISGTIYNSQVVGYYCPATGRLAFTRQVNGQSPASQMYVGNVSDVLAGQPHRMGGTFHAVNTGAGSGALGEYHFQGQK